MTWTDLVIRSIDRLFMPAEAGKLIGNVISRICSLIRMIYEEGSQFSVFSDWDEILVEKISSAPKVMRIYYTRENCYLTILLPQQQSFHWPHPLEKKRDLGPVLRERTYSLAKWNCKWKKNVSRVSSNGQK